MSSPLTKRYFSETGSSFVFFLSVPLSDLLSVFLSVLKFVRLVSSACMICLVCFWDGGVYPSIRPLICLFPILPDLLDLLVSLLVFQLFFPTYECRSLYFVRLLSVSVFLPVSPFVCLSISLFRLYICLSVLSVRLTILSVYLSVSGLSVSLF